MQFNKCVFRGSFHEGAAMRLRKGLVALLTATVVLTAWARVQGQDKQNPAADPKPRDKGWVKRHEGFVDIAKKGDVDVLFLGDSITDAWRSKDVKNNRGGKDVWDKTFAPLKAANFGIGGDQT